MGPETMGRVRLGAAIALLALLLAGACLRPAPAAATVKTDILHILTKNGVAGVADRRLRLGHRHRAAGVRAQFLHAARAGLQPQAAHLGDRAPRLGPGPPLHHGALRPRRPVAERHHPRRPLPQGLRRPEPLDAAIPAPGDAPQDVVLRGLRPQAAQAGRAQGQGRRDRRRGLVRQAPHGPGLEARHPDRVRAAFGALRQRRAGRRQPRLGPCQVVGQAADQGAQGAPASR